MPVFLLHIAKAGLGWGGGEFTTVHLPSHLKKHPSPQADQILLLPQVTSWPLALLLVLMPVYLCCFFIFPSVVSVQNLTSWFFLPNSFSCSHSMPTSSYGATTNSRSWSDAQTITTTRDVFQHLFLDLSPTHLYWSEVLMKQVDNIRARGNTTSATLFLNPAQQSLCPNIFQRIP